MKLLKASVYGFGKWVDVQFSFTPKNDDNNFICFYGKNESGKSTLQQFILYIFFGLPPRQREQYRPRKSHQFGGTLTVIDESIGEWVIERVEDNVRCIFPNDEEKNERWLQEKLQYGTRKMVTDVYAFSAMDLEKIRQIKQS